MFRLVERQSARLLIPGGEITATEMRRVGLLRILLGVIVVLRLWQMVEPVEILGPVLDYNVPLFYVTLIASVLFTVGFLTPVATGTLLVTLNWLDTDLSCRTLGTSVLTIVLFGFFAMNCTGLSLDRLLARVGPFHRQFSKLSTPFVDAAGQRRVFYLLFVSYALMNLLALTYHLTDSSWMKGETLHRIFTSSYLCQHWTMMRKLDASFPQVMQLISWCGCVGQAIYQGLMIPLMRYRLGRLFVVVWGACFILSSVLLLQLGSLGYYEIVLWLLLFARSWKEPALEGIRHGKDTREVSTGSCDPASSWHQWGVRTAMVTIVLFVISHVGMRVAPSRELHILNSSCYYAGLQVPNVFNRVDLSMGDCWPIIEREHDGKRRLVPLSGHNGERLDYLNNDILYFAFSLRWRRSVIDMKQIKLVSPVNKFLNAIVLYDYVSHGLTGPANYHVRVFRLQDRPKLGRKNTFAASQIEEFTIPFSDQAYNSVLMSKSR